MCLASRLPGTDHDDEIMSLGDDKDDDLYDDLMDEEE